jgi:hypothetical protein
MEETIMESAELTKKNAVPESLTSLGFKIRTFGPLPEGFDPLTATDRQLAEHGLPRRPDAQTETRLRRLWERTMTQTKTWIAPEFTEVKRGDLSISHRRPATAFFDHAPHPSWSGAVQKLAGRNGSGANLDEEFVTGQWTVTDPNVAKIPNSERNKDWVERTWVGIYQTTRDSFPYSTDVVQAGTTTHVYPPGSSPRRVGTYAWWEWYPAKPHAISNFTVSLGDVVFCVVDVYDNAGAAAVFANLSTGVATGFQITPPSGTALAGNTVVWIVERPTAAYGSDEYAMLPDYVTRYFDFCVAGWIGSTSVGQEDLLHPDSSTLLTMTNNDGETLSVPTIESENLLKVEWVKSA